MFLLLTFFEENVFYLARMGMWRWCLEQWKAGTAQNSGSCNNSLWPTKTGMLDTGSAALEDSFPSRHLLCNLPRGKKNIYLPIYPSFIHSLMHPSVHLSTHLFLHPPIIHQSFHHSPVHLPVHPFTFLPSSTYPSVHSFSSSSTHPFVLLCIYFLFPFYLFTCLSTELSTHQLIHLLIPI